MQRTQHVRTLRPRAGRHSRPTATCGLLALRCCSLVGTVGIPTVSAACAGSYQVYHLDATADHVEASVSSEVRTTSRRTTSTEAVWSAGTALRPLAPDY